MSREAKRDAAGVCEIGFRVDVGTESFDGCGGVRERIVGTRRVTATPRANVHELEPRRCSGAIGATGFGGEHRGSQVALGLRVPAFFVGELAGDELGFGLQRRALAIMR